MSARIRAPGLWTAGSVITPAEMDTLDENQSKNVDGRGGTYAPSTPIVIGEASPGVGGLRVTAKAQFDGPFECNAPSAAFTAGVVVDALAIFTGTVLANDAQVSGTFQVGSNATFGGTLTANAPLVVNAASTFNADVTIGAGLLAGATILGSLAVSGAATINGLTTATGGIIVGSAGVIIGGGGGLVVTGDTTLQDVEIAGLITLTGNARIRQRVIIGADANSSYGPATADFVHAATLTAARDYTIDDTGAVNGDVIEFSNYNGTHTITIRRPGGSVIGNIRFAAGVSHYLKCVRISGSWEQVNFAVS